MKTPILLALVALITKIKAQGSGDVEVVALSETEAPAGEPEFKYVTRPIVNMTDAEVKAYEKDPKNKPKVDSKPTGKTEKQSKTAGVSYLKTSGQIVCGSQAVQGQFPWQVYLIANNAWLCGGSIISAFWVLTAAHCVYGGTSYVVTAGGINRNTAEVGEVTRTSTNSQYNSGYNPSTLVNDIGLIKFTSAWTFTSTINSVRLPRLSQATLTYAGLSAVASGYGRTSNTSPASTFLNFVTLTVMTNSACAAVYGGTTVISSTICTTGGTTCRSTCSGDSGGPLQLRERDGRYTQIGVVSFGAAASCNGYPSGYARVGSFLGWISLKTGIIILP